MNNYIEFILFLTVVALVGFFVLVFTGLRQQRKRWQKAFEEDERERKRIANEMFKCNVARSLTADARMQQDIRKEPTFEGDIDFTKAVIKNGTDIVKQINESASDSDAQPTGSIKHGAVIVTGTISNASLIDTSSLYDRPHETSDKEVEVYQSRAERRKQGERGSLQLRATLPQKVSDC